MKASQSLQDDQSTATENALRRAVDTTPAFTHTARADGYLDYFNRGWLDLLGQSLDDVCGWRWTESVHPEDLAGIVQKWRAGFGKRGNRSTLKRGFGVRMQSMGTSAREDDE